MRLQAACPPRAACGTTRIHALVRRAKRAPAASRELSRSNALQFAKYRQGYTEICADRSSAGANDASTRQKLAFHS
jgi:hypothetical protein